MKPSKKGLVFLTLVLVISVCLLSGCSAKKDTSTSTPPADQNTTDKQVTISDMINQGTQITEMTYEIKTTGEGISYESEVWLKDKKMKTDTTMNGQRMISFFDMTNSEIITYMPDQKIATKMKMDQYEGEDNITPVNYLQGLSGVEYITQAGNETINGLDCKVITITEPEGTIKEWLSVKYGIVVKSEQKINGQVSTTEFKNFKIGPGTVSDNDLTVPSDVQVVDMSTMMGN